MSSGFSHGHGICISEGSHSKPQETFATLWAEATRKFQQNDNVSPKLFDNLFDRLSGCKETHDVLIVLDELVKKMKDFNTDDPKWKNVRNKYLWPAIQVLLLFNDAIAECASHFPAIPGGKAIFVAFGVVLQATSGVSERCEILIGLFEQLNSFLERLSIRLATPRALGAASKTLAITILAHLLDVFLIAAKLFSQPAWRTRLTMYRQALTKDKEMSRALDRLRVLTELEMRAMAVETQVAVMNSHAEMQDITSQMTLEIQKMYQDLFTFTRTEQQKRTRLETSRMLEKLERVESADINAQNPNGCLQGTRVGILAQLREWSLDQSSPRIFWLNGMAGIGKSAIARSFCRTLQQDKLLGGSFFCSRQRSVEEGDASRIISTLSVSLALHDPDYLEELLAEIEKQPFSRHWNLQIQIQRLLHNPYAHIGPSAHSMPIFVIDALDECSDQGITRDLLFMLVDVARCLPVKFFLTSRPEPHIRHQLERLNASIGKVLRLHDIERDIVEVDIHLYLTHELSEMRKNLLPTFTTWPSEEDVDVLVRLSGRLFIYAFTAMVYIGRSPIKRLSKITGAIAAATPALTQPLDVMYNMILSDAMDPEVCEPDELHDTRHMMAVIITLQEPLTVMSLAGLLDMHPRCVRESLDKLYAVIYMPVRDDDGLVSTFHASFGDFLTTPGRSPEYMHSYIRDRHTYLADACLALLQSDRLHFNVSRSPNSYHVTHMEEEVMDVGLRYACLYWSDHIRSTSQHDWPHLLDTLERLLLGPKFLFWLEALIALGCYEMADGMLEKIEIPCFEPSITPKGGLYMFIRDGKSFIRASQSGIKKSTPHLYLSALAFCPTYSAVYKYCMPSFSNLPKAVRHLAQPSISSKGPVVTATFSSDGSYIVVGLHNKEVNIWNTESGQLVKKLRPRKSNITWLISTGVSPDSSRVIAAYTTASQFTLCSWDLKTSAMMERTVRPLGFISSFVAFSADGRQFAFGHTEREVPQSAQNLATPKLYCHTAFSHDALLYDIETDTFLRFRSGIHAVSAVAFSPDGRYLVCGYDDGTVRLWDAHTSRLIYGPLETPSRAPWARSSVTVVAFAPDGLSFMACRDYKVYSIWCTNTGSLMVTHETLKCGVHWASIYPTMATSIPHETDRVQCQRHAAVDLDRRLSSRAISDGRRIDILLPYNTIFGNEHGAIRIWDPLTNSRAYMPFHQVDDFVGASSDNHKLVTRTYHPNNAITVWYTNLGLVSDGRRRFSFGPDLSHSLRDYPCEPPGPSSNTSISSNGEKSSLFRLNTDGWIEDLSRNPPGLLLWVPKEFREGLYLPPMALTIASHETWSLDLSEFVHGTRWTECYRGDLRTD